jgi:hypothetical protein
MKTLIIGVAASLFAVSTAFADVHLTMQGGRVSLVAKDATIRQILTEWARVGHTQIVNVEKVPGGPVTLELTNVPEAQALDVVMRSLSGYITAPRPVEAANLSQFDRIIVMPTLASARPATASGPPPPPVFQQGPAFNIPVQADDDGDDERANPNTPVAGGQRGPVFNTFPQPQGTFPQPGANPNMPPVQQPVQTPAAGTPIVPYGGVAVPGMVAPPPPVPAGQQPGAPGQPIRRPGGPGGQ